MYKNLSYKVIIPQMKPMFYVKDNKITSDVEEIKFFTNVIPNIKTEFMLAEQFEIGTINETGHYSGLLGYIQRLEADLVYYPIPFDIYEAPGIFAVPLIESGTKILTITTSTHKKNTDISEFFLHFDIRLVLLILVNFIFLAIFIHQITKIRFSETIYILYQSLLKEQVLKKFEVKKSFFTVALLFYHYVLFILIEANVNTSLVVYDTPKSIETLNDLYEDKKKKPYFVKEHFSNDYFTNKYRSKVADSIYQKAEKGNCIIEAQEIFNQLFVGSSKRTDFAVLTEALVLIGFRNMLCYNNFNFVNSVGSSHLSKELYKVPYSTLFRKNIDQTRFKLYNQKVYNMIEVGFAPKCIENFGKSLFGLPKNIEPGFKKCMSRNDVEIFQDNFHTIKLNNVKYLITIYLLFLIILWFIFIFLKCIFNSLTN